MYTQFAGLKALARTIASKAKALVILDCKRNGIGNTASAYAAVVGSDRTWRM